MGGALERGGELLSCDAGGVFHLAVLAPAHGFRQF
jgi:hypothetical protein